MQTNSQKSVDKPNPQKSISVLVEQSIGEAIDKFTILGIKSKELSGNHAKFATMEKDSIHKSLIDAGVCGFAMDENYLGLVTINTTLWDLENDIRSMESALAECELKINVSPLFSEQYVKTSRKIRELNEIRAHHKNQLNITFGSKFQEVKCYSGFETEV